MNIDHRLAAGHVDVTTLLSGNRIRLFPRQTDMGTAHWHVNALATGTPRYQVIRTSMSGKVQGQGYFVGRIVWDILGFKMVDYLIDTFYGGDEWLQSAPVTYGAYDHREEAFYMQCEMVQPDWDALASGNRNARGYNQVVFPLIRGIKIEAAP